MFSMIEIIIYLIIAVFLFVFGMHLMRKLDRYVEHQQQEQKHKE